MSLILVGIFVGASIAVGPPAQAVDLQRANAPIIEDAATNKPTSLLVRFKSSVSNKTVTKVSQEHDLQKKWYLHAGDVSVYQITDGEDSAEVAKQLLATGTVDLVEPDYDVAATAVTNDGLANSLWGLENTGQNINGSTGINNIDTDAPAAWPTTTGAGVLVGVLDEGVEINHPDLASHIWTNTADCFNDGIDHDHDGYINDCHGWDFFNDDNSVFDPADGDDHGTHVAGTIGAIANNNLGVAGVAPNVTILPLKFLGPNGGSISDAISAIQYAKDHGVKIINCSWGGPAYSQALKDAMATSGMTFAVAAGNDGNNITSVPEYPAAFDLPNVITVAAINNRGGLASFSNYGGTTDVGAPGVDIISTVPKKVAAGVTIENTPVGGAYKSAFWGFGLENVTGATDRQTVLSSELNRLGAITPTSPIVIVDDDESSSGNSATPDTASYYTTALTALGYTNVNVIEVAKDASGPAEGTLHGKTVIWETGYAEGSQNTYTLTSTDLSQLTTFVNGGGNILLAGSDAIWRNETDNFVQNKLGVEFVSEGDSRHVAGGVAAPFNGVTVNLDGVDSPKHTVNPYIDNVQPWVTSATVGLALPADATYNGAYGSMSGTSMATPHVSGILALAAAAAPSASPTALVNFVKGTTTALAALGSGKTSSGGMANAAQAVAAAVASTAVPITTTPAPTSTLPAIVPPSSSSASTGSASVPTGGYRFVAADGGIFSFGTSSFEGSTGASKLNEPIVAMAATPDGKGYWLVARDGGIFNFGTAAFWGSTGGIKLNSPIVGIAAVPNGKGYWLVAADGGIFSFGSAGFFGSTGAIKLNQPIISIAATPDGRGYWLIARDGGIFSFGTAGFFGSTGAIKLNSPIVAASSSVDGKGYWLVAADGGIFSFGTAGFFGSTGAAKLNEPIVSFSSTADGKGYWMVARDGGVFAFGSASFFGSTGAIKLNSPIVAVTH